MKDHQQERIATSLAEQTSFGQEIRQIWKETALVILKDTVGVAEFLPLQV